MDILVLIIFALIGGVIGIIFGWDPYKIGGQIGVAIFALASIPFIFALTLTHDINTSTNILTKYVDFWANNFVAIILGDVAGQIAGSLLSPFNK